MFDDIQREWNRMNEVYKRLQAEPCMKIPKVGDRVIVAAGLLGMGHNWIRLEATVEEVADTTTKVNFVDYKRPLTKEDVVVWIDNVLITDVLPTADKEV